MGVTVRKLAAIFNSGGVSSTPAKPLILDGMQGGTPNNPGNPHRRGSGNSPLFPGREKGPRKGFLPMQRSPVLRWMLLAGLCTCHDQPVQGQRESPPVPSIAVQQLSRALEDFGGPRPVRYRACEALPLGQFWKGEDRFPEEAGVAYAGATGQGLSFYVHLLDSDIFSRATGDEQKMPALGDVVEIFVKAGSDRPDYWEIHVTPNDFLLDIHIPDRTRISKGGTITWEQVEPFVPPASGAARRVAVTDSAWSVEVTVPWSAFGRDAPPAPGSVWKFAVCRYNYSGGLEDPELSSTAHLTELNFHRHEEYTDLVF